MRLKQKYPARGLTIYAWKAQRNRAKQRGIEFRFSYDEWLAWWQAALALRGDDAERGKQRGMLLMCRIGDQGAYEPGNVYCGTDADNAADIPPEKRRLGHYWLKGTTGAAHPRSKAIGAFPSLTAAAAHYRISRTEVRRRLADGRLNMDATVGSVRKHPLSPTTET